MKEPAARVLKSDPEGADTRGVKTRGPLERLERQVTARVAPLLRGGLERPPYETLRAEVTILATLLFCAVGVPLALRCWLLGAPRIAVAVAGLMGLGVVNVLALRRAHRVMVSAHTAVSLLVLLLVVAGLCSGGFYDPAFSWLFVAPLLAFLLTDLRGGWLWTAIVSAITVAFWGCGAGVSDPSESPSASQPQKATVMALTIAVHSQPPRRSVSRKASSGATKSHENAGS